MKVMSVADEEISDVLHVLSGVLQLGNVNFMSAGGAQVTEKSSMSVFFVYFYQSTVWCWRSWISTPPETTLRIACTFADKSAAFFSMQMAGLTLAF